MRMFIVMFLTTVFLAASFQFSTAKETDGLLVYFAFEDGTGETVTESVRKRTGWIIRRRYRLDQRQIWKGTQFRWWKTDLFVLFIPVSLNLQRESPYVHGFVLPWKEVQVNGNS